MESAKTLLPHRGRGAGFSLIEVTLALLVFAVGIMAILALFPTGVKSNRDTTDHTSITQFAESVLNCVATELQLNPEFWTTTDFDGYVKDYVYTNSVPRFGVWADEDSLRIQSDGKEHALLYRPRSDLARVDLAVRYTLSLKRTEHATAELLVDPHGGPALWTASKPPTAKERAHEDYPDCYVIKPGFYVTETPVKEYVGMDPHMVKITLTVKPGEYGGTGERTFYRYYYNFLNR